MSIRQRLVLIASFGVTMGIFEAAVVVYLRRLWDLGAVDIAHVSLSNPLVVTEVLREAASLAMIGTVACLAGKRGIERLGFAAIIFGVWDLVYYLVLRLRIGWPESVLDWDVLFLIPRPWIGPVLAPVLVSIALIAGGIAVVSREANGPRLAPRPLDWLACLLGGSVVIASFLVVEVPRMAAGSPAGFSWLMFLAGLTIACAGFLSAVSRTRVP